MTTVKRGRWVDEVVSWISDKPLPEDPRWPDGWELSMVIDFARKGGSWAISPGSYLRPEQAMVVLIEELDDGLVILRQISESLDGAELAENRNVVRALQKIRDKVVEEHEDLLDRLAEQEMEEDAIRFAEEREEDRDRAYQDWERSTINEITNRY